MTAAIKPACTCGHSSRQHIARVQSPGGWCIAQPCQCKDYTPRPPDDTPDRLSADLYCAMCGSSIHIEGAAAETQSPINVWTQVHAHTPKDRYR